MYDAIDAGAFEWVDKALGTFERVVGDCRLLADNALPKDLQSTLALDDLKGVIYSYTDKSLFVGRHLFQALQMRHLARKHGSFSWYCAATYALCHDWGRVLDSVDWIGWGGDAAIDSRLLKAVTVLVGAHEYLPTAQMMEAMSVLAMNKEQETIRQAVQRKLICWVRERDRFELGVRAPVPNPF